MPQEIGTKSMGKIGEKNASKGIPSVLEECATMRERDEDEPIKLLTVI